MNTVYMVTLSRSDYASLRPVALAALRDKELNVKIIAGGSHLLKRFGNTIEQIRKDGLDVHAVADFLSEADDSPAELAHAYAKAVNAFVAIFAAGKPDSIFIVGDRWEMLAVASAASMLQIPVIHHSGGDITQGSADNQTRYALTCLSHLHLVALDEHRERLLAMGEESWRVITTGEPALSGLARHAKAFPHIHEHLGLATDEPFVLATFHPTSFDPLPPEQQIDTFISVLNAIPQRIIITAPNPDAASDIFFRKLVAFAQANERVKLFESLGDAYYAAMAAASYMIGNSSSGLWEAPSFHLPVLNIGPRQNGRVHGANVLNVPLEKNAIIEGIATVSNPAFRTRLANETNPYVRKNTLTLIVDCLKQPHDKARLLGKHFIDPLHVSVDSRQ